MHCSNNIADRSIGKYWEKNFCRLAAEFGKVFTPLQIGRESSASAYSLNRDHTWNIFTLPDITIWSYPGEHHEIKHKAPTSKGYYGLERYRLDRLLEFANTTKQDVLYTIHNHALNGGRDGKENHIEHWFIANIYDLDETWIYIDPRGTSWVNGEKHENIPICYWSASLWNPLSDYWNKESEIIEDAIPF